MRNVAEALGRPARKKYAFDKIDWPNNEQLIGLEVEVDSTNVKRPKFPELDSSTLWRRTSDGSLRNGYEYVLRNPLAGNALSEAIHEFFSSEPVLYRTSTGSTHIHIDMMEENTPVEAIKTMVMLLFVLESAIFEMYDPGREWCGFTNRLTAAPADSLGAILGLDLKEVFDRGMMNPHDRYYGLNVQALGKYGSLELRYFPTAQNKEELIDWIKLAQSFKIAAVELGDIQAFQEVMANEESYTNFLAKYFEPWKDRILQAVPHYMALASYNKAMAITETYIYSNSNDTSYGQVDYSSIFSQEKYSGLVKISEEEEKERAAEVGTVRLHTSIVPANQANEGDLIVSGRVAYAALTTRDVFGDSTRRQWVPIYSNSVELNNLRRHRATLLAIRNTIIERIDIWRRSETIDANGFEALMRMAETIDAVIDREPRASATQPGAGVPIGTLPPERNDAVNSIIRQYADALRVMEERSTTELSVGGVTTAPRNVNMSYTRRNPR